MKKDSDETMKMTRLNNNELQLQEDKREDKEDHLAGNHVLETALLRGLIQKRVLKNPRYLLVMRRLRLLAYRAAQKKQNPENKEEMPEDSSLSKYLEQLDPKKIFSN